METPLSSKIRRKFKSSDRSCRLTPIRLPLPPARRMTETLFSFTKPTFSAEQQTNKLGFEPTLPRLTARPTIARSCKDSESI